MMKPTATVRPAASAEGAAVVGAVGKRVMLPQRLKPQKMAKKHRPLMAKPLIRTTLIPMVTSRSVVAVSVVAETAAKPAAMMRLQKAQKRPTTPMPKPKRLKRVLKVPAKT